MTHRSFPRAFRVGRSANVALVSGTGGLLGKNQRMPMPAPAAPSAGAGGFRGLPGRNGPAAPNRGTGDCGNGYATQMTRTQQACGNYQTDVPASLTSTVATIGPGDTAAVTATVTGGASFSVFGAWTVPGMDGCVVEQINNPQGQNILPNGTEVLSEFMSNRAEEPFYLNGCAVMAALSLTAVIRNDGDSTVSAQIQYVGKY